ncbi:PREDICTED: solute carrier family 12 member 9-like [Nanorana parkeri]|uniref:solute carrier family 12 member 9-like n=1 Tax=Nanorana parkeri TaxID=125878 RepID=UPI0008548066|nr:PREDICTED: solute carrier family 12 member 9-like [Nanorana parkeri]
MDEQSPLIIYPLSTEEHPNNGAATRKDSAHRSGTKKLSTFLGVVVPTLLAMFSVVLFLRIGFVVGQSGLYETIGMLILSYFIIGMTVLSVCAISTNGALDAGGAYYMISRALGPEFGGSIGVMFFFANVFGSALYILGLVETIVAMFGIQPGHDVKSGVHVLPQSYWYEFLYGTVLLFICLLVCLVGASIYAKATFIIFIVVMVVLIIVFISFFAVKEKIVPINTYGNSSSALNGTFTGFRLSTLKDNVYPHYAQDYTTGRMMSFTTVFAVMFNGCTGIMAGSNMSGDLKSPSYSIPRGTITAVIFTYIIYNLLALMVSCTCDRTLLQNDYSFLRDINICPPLVTIGIYCSTLSASMSNLIGASRILYALAKDKLFGNLLMPANVTSRGGNPWVSVIISWFLVQLVLFAGKLNTIAAIVTIFFLLVYAAVGLACVALEWASAPNFRPTFRYFTWYTCILGIVGCVTMMFLINQIYASASIVFMLLLLLCLHYWSPGHSWGYISQALIFHQVRKYLLMLDVRKDHVKFWRPQILLLVSNPEKHKNLIIFANDLKKSGLFVLGHVRLEELDVLPFDPLQPRTDSWLKLVDELNIKAFVNLTLSDSVRYGAQQLLFISGLGGMRPNTVILGFYSRSTPEDLVRNDQELQGPTPFVYTSTGRRPTSENFSSWEYVAIISDSIKMSKNVVLARNFSELDRSHICSLKGKDTYIDVWPLNLLRPDSATYVNTCSLFLLQMACVLNMVHSWKKAKLRLFLCVERDSGLRGQEVKLKQLLKDLRIKASIHTVVWDAVVALHWHKQAEFADIAEEVYLNYPNNSIKISDDYLEAVNQMILGQNPTAPPAVRFLYLPRPPADRAIYNRFLNQVEAVSRNLGPTLLIHGVTPVTSTEL